MNPFVGEIKMFSGNFAPQNWAFCNGQTLQITQYPQLFSIVGTTYGGNGTTEFALPDLRSRSPVHQGQGSNGLSLYTLGQTAGSETTSLATTQLPTHNHIMAAIASGQADQGVPTGNYLSTITNPKTGAYTNFYSNGSPDVIMNANAILPTGLGEPVPIVHPVLAISFIIALAGAYPTRN